MGNNIHLPPAVGSFPRWAAPRLGDGEQGPQWYLEAPAWAVLGQDADVGGVSAGTDEAGQMLVLDIPHLRGSRV